MPWIWSSQIVHSTTLPLKLGCGTRWVTLRFNIVVLYMLIYSRSTEEILHLSRSTDVIGHTMDTAIPKILVSEWHNMHFDTMTGTSSLNTIIVRTNHDVLWIYDQDIDVKHGFTDLSYPFIKVMIYHVDEIVVLLKARHKPATFVAFHWVFEFSHVLVVAGW